MNALMICNGRQGGKTTALLDYLEDVGDWGGRASVVVPDEQQAKMWKRLLRERGLSPFIEVYTERGTHGVGLRGIRQPVVADNVDMFEYGIRGLIEQVAVVELFTYTPDWSSSLDYGLDTKQPRRPQITKDDIMVAWMRAKIEGRI